MPCVKVRLFLSAPLRPYRVRKKFLVVASTGHRDLIWPYARSYPAKTQSIWPNKYKYAFAYLLERVWVWLHSLICSLHTHGRFLGGLGCLSYSSQEPRIGYLQDCSHQIHTHLQQVRQSRKTDKKPCNKLYGWTSKIIPNTQYVSSATQYV